jgi:type 2 lantibiotic biosynthesis protein LanM
MSTNQWLLAQNLTERINNLKATAHLQAPFNPKRADKRLEQWRTGGFEDPDHWKLFLETHELTEQEFYRLLGEEADAVAARSPQPPKWLVELLEIYDGKTESLPLTGYLKVLRPLVSHYHRCLLTEAQAAVKGAAEPAFDPTVATKALLESLLHKLRLLIPRTMILETNIARVEGRLSGATPEARFENFVASLDDTKVCLAILKEYPVLARQCYTTCRNWYVANAEFLRRLQYDHAELRRFFKTPNLGPLVKIEGNVGDSHKQGRAVQIVEFANKTKLVYKPRPLAPDAAFQNIVAWLNDRGQTPPLKTFAILDCKTHGWTEYVPYLPCQSDAEIERFYTRQGSWVAVLYAFGVTDLHLENLIASGEHPMIIDLETIFHPRLHEPKSATADDLAAEILGNSVATSGLLPSPLRFEGKVMDKSGMGAVANQELPIQVDGFEGAGTDEVRVEKVPGRIGEVRNLPTLHGVQIDFKKFLPQVLKGFESTYQLILHARDELLSAHGPLAEMRDLPIRVVVRATSTYSSYLNESLHPQRCRDAMGREQLFAQIWDFARIVPLYTRLCSAERRQLLMGDIPYFQTTISSHNMIAGDGTVIENLLAQSGWNAVMGRLKRLGQDDFQRQKWQIEAAFVASLGDKAVIGKPEIRPTENARIAAENVAERLMETAIVKEDSVSWIALRFRLDGQGPEGGHYDPGVVETDLYSGLTGIALFFAYLSKVTGQTKYRDFTNKIVNTLEERVEKQGPPPLMGAFSGLAGWIYAYTHLGDILDRPALLDRACEWVKRLKPADDKVLDLIAGSAGCIGVMLGLHQIRPKSQALDVAKQFGERLKNLSGEELTAMPNHRGFSHGFSGLAWGLAKLAAVTGDQSLHGPILKILARERELLSGQVWSDVPNNPTQCTWCHGAYGIALARLDIYRDLPLNEIRDDAHRALEVAMTTPSLVNQILCHGTIGNLETILQARQILTDEPRWAQIFDEHLNNILKEIRTHGWISPLPAQMMEPGLMKGLAGIGMGLLRMTAPEIVPSVLVLAPPN